MMCDYFGRWLVAHLLFLAKYYESIDYYTYHEIAEWIRRLIEESQVGYQNDTVTRDMLYKLDKKNEELTGKMLFEWEGDEDE